MNIFDRWESEIRGYCRAYPTIFSTAQNARQTDEAGKEYIDFFAGAGVLNFGHNNEHMKSAIIDFIQSNGVAHSLDMSTSVKAAFMEAFVETVLKPRKMDYKMQFMGPTGTNAVEAALKLARRVTGRSTIYAFSHGFHGMTLGSLACTANSYFRNAAGVTLDNVHRLPFEGQSDSDAESLGKLKNAFDDPSCGLEPPAAFIVETIQAEGGVNVASPEWLKMVQQIAHDLGALFIIDDIQVGCGRTGSYFSFDGYDLDPDIITLAKGIGGFGTPLAMNLNKPELDKHWSPGEHTGTFRGQGISFVAGKEALRYFQDNELMTDVLRKGEVMKDRLERINKRYPNHGFKIRGRGMIQAIDVEDGAVAKKIATESFHNGMIIGPCGSGGRVLKLIPPLTIPDADLAEGLNVLDKSFKTVLG